MATKKASNNVVEVVSEVGYEKSQFVASSRYSRRKDLLSALLEDGKKYTPSQVDALIKEFDKKDFTERKGE